jgi:hypothetical protein
LNENESPGNLLHLARVLGRISRKYAGDFVRFLIVNRGNEINEYLEFGANLSQAAGWVRVLRLAGRKFVTNYIEPMGRALQETMTYDQQLYHLLETTEAFIECGQSKMARRAALFAQRQAIQARSACELSHMIKILMKSLRIESHLGLEGFAANIFAHVSTEQMHLLLMREAVGRTVQERVVAAFGLYLLASLNKRGFERFQPDIARLQARLIESAQKESRGGTRALIQIFCRAPEEHLKATAALADWESPLERGLAQIFYRTLNSDREGPFAAAVKPVVLRWDKAPSFGLTPHGRNAEFGILYQLARACEIPTSFARNLDVAAAERLEDEISSPTRSLLSSPLRISAGFPSYNLWAILHESFLRASQLQWSDEILEVGRAIAFREPVENRLEILSG